MLCPNHSRAWSSNQFIVYAGVNGNCLGLCYNRLFIMHIMFNGIAVCCDKQTLPVVSEMRVCVNQMICIGRNTRRL